MKSLKHIKYFIVFIVIICPTIIVSTACSQDLNSVSAAFNQYHQNSLREKIFVHTDKNFYVTGEILWFKIYDVDASSHKPLQLSKVAYVEISDSLNKSLLRAKIALDNAEGNGSFYLPVNLNSGNYKLRAYTSWMKNFDIDYFFEKNITIVNVQKRLDVPPIKSSVKIKLDLFPEGGNMVNDIPCKIAFKATDQYGKGINFQGFLLDNNDTVLMFKPTHEGMGFFVFTPLYNHPYRAFLKADSGQNIIKDLDPAFNSGYVMNLTDSADKIIVAVHSDISQEHIVYLFAHTREIVKVSASNYLQNRKAVFVFDKAILGDGISHITIFNDQKQPVCERLYFKKPADQLQIKLNTDQKLYTTRKKVSLNIQSINTEIKNDTTSLSMSVIRLDSLQSFNTTNINTYLLLTSDLSGYIEDPDYYFSNNNAETNAALDNLMLTNGWRRFKWEEILKNTKPYFGYAPEYNGMIISGKVTNTITRGPAANVETYISIPGLQSEFNSAVSDKESNSKFEMKNFYGSSEIILQPNTVRDSIYHIEINDPFSSNFSSTVLPAFSLQQSIADALRKQSISMQVQNIYSGKKLRHFIGPAVVDSGTFYTNTDAKYLLDNYTRFTTIEEVLREYVSFVNVKKRDGDFHYNLLDLSNNQMLNADPFVLLDGVPVFDFNKFMELDPLKLYKLEVLNRRYFLGQSVFNGVLNWTSYKGDLADYDPGPHATIIDFEGLQAEREFYSPVYENEDQLSSHLPDFRSLLQWSPNIKIAPGSSSEINFYTSDLPGKYLIEVQGISKNGICGSKAFTFEVKK